MHRQWFYLLGILLVTGCQQSAASPGKEGGASGPMPVSVSKPIVKEINDVEEFTGRVEAVDKVDIRSQVTGYLEKIHFKSGYEVKKGDLLFTIDDRLYAAEYESAKGSLGQAEARQQKMQADLERAKKLMKTSGAMSQEEFDKINAETSEVIASVATARANLDRAQKNLAYTKITAPIAGRISRNLISEGNLVSANTTILTDIVSIDPVHIYFDIDERTIMRIQDMIQKGKFVSARKSDSVKVRAALGNDIGFPHEGVIDFVDNKIDPKLGAMWIRGIFPNPIVANYDRRFTPGMFVRVQLPVGPPHAAVLITDRAIGTDQGNKFVFVVDKENKASYRPVKLGVIYEGLRVIEEGLKAEDLVVVNGILRVRPGAVVAPKLVDMPASAGGMAPMNSVKPEKSGEKAPPLK